MDDIDENQNNFIVALGLQRYELCEILILCEFHYYCVFVKREADRDTVTLTEKHLIETVQIIQHIQWGRQPQALVPTLTGERDD